jgi:hypothetical protein
MRRRWDAHLLTLRSYQAVDKIDFCATALEHVLAGGGAPLVGHALQAGKR